MTNVGGKRLFRLALTVLVFLLSVTAGNSIQAAGGLILEVEEVTANAGGQAVVEITAENAAGLEGGQFMLLFESALVMPVEVKAGPLIEGVRSPLHMANLNYERGKMLFMWVTAAGDTDDSGVLCRVVFDLLEEGETTLELEEILIVPEGTDEVTVRTGRITIGEGTGIPVETDRPAVTEDEQPAEPADTDGEPAVGSDGSTGGAAGRILIGGIVLIALFTAVFLVSKRRKTPGSQE